jgi:DNA-directed RNA polymerase specialized sigma24 family protein
VTAAARPIDRLVRAAQRGDRRALEEVLGLLRAPLTRFAGKLAPGDPAREDAVQEALQDIASGIRSYRWESSFLSWCYTVCARRVTRAAVRTAAELERVADQLAVDLIAAPDVYEGREAILADQDLHLSCSMAVATGLSPALRQAYLLGDVLGVIDQVGGEICGCTPAAFRQRVSRARRAVSDQIRDGLVAAGSPVVDPAWPDELDRLVRLGELHRARGRSATPDAAERAAALAAPKLMALGTTA